MLSVAPPAEARVNPVGSSRRTARMAGWEALLWAGVNDDPGTLPRTRLTRARLGVDARRLEWLRDDVSSGPRDPVAQIELLPVSLDQTPAERVPFSCSGHRHGRDAERDSASSITRMAPPPPGPAIEFARPASTASGAKNLEEPVWIDEPSSLGDSLWLSPPPHSRTRSERAVPTRTPVSASSPASHATRSPVPQKQPPQGGGGALDTSSAPSAACRLSRRRSGSAPLRESEP